MGHVIDINARVSVELRQESFVLHVGFDEQPDTVLHPEFGYGDLEALGRALQRAGRSRAYEAYWAARPAAPKRRALKAVALLDGVVVAELTDRVQHSGSPYVCAVVQRLGDGSYVALSWHISSASAARKRREWGRASPNLMVLPVEIREV
jgi:hypothetical protein